MKPLATLVSLLFSSILFGQTEPDSISGVRITGHELYSETDTIPVVIYLKNKENINKPIIYLNGKIVNNQAIENINPESIEKIKVDKNPDYKNDVNSPGKIFITMKKTWEPELISLNELKTKYTKTSNAPTLFMLNDKTIKADYNEYLVDEHYILKIEVENIKNTGEELDLNIIRLITRTKENLEKANTIYLRGDKN